MLATPRVSRFFITNLHLLPSSTNPICIGIGVKKKQVSISCSLNRESWRFDEILTVPSAHTGVCR